MSPVHIPRGFTKAYIAGEVVEDLRRADPDGPRRVRRDRDILLIEGTGHAGVGAVIGLSNAAVAAMLGAPAVIVSARAASAGRSTRSCSTPRCSSATACTVAGRDRQQGRPRRASPGSAGRSSGAWRATASRCWACCRTGRSSRTRRSAMILEGVRGETIHPGPDLDQVIDGVAIGAMEPEHMLERVGPGTLVIVPGDREDVIAGDRRGASRRRRRGRRAGPRADRRLPAQRPRSSTRSARRTCSRRSWPRTPTVASEVHDLLVKTHPADHGKIDKIKALVWEYLFIDRILRRRDARPAG